MLPYFYIKEFDAAQSSIVLDEDNARHAVQVLRMKMGESLHLTDGKGHLITASITNDHKKHCEVQVLEIERKAPNEPGISIAIALTKNASRFEWFLEKAAELGVKSVIPLITKRTEKQKFKEERLQNILVSAMLQSQQSWLLQLEAPVEFDAFIIQDHLSCTNRYIAHCIESNKQSLQYQTSSSIILIGPEGDFTPEEINIAMEKGYQPVTLGAARLRTETAGIVAAAILRVGSSFAR
ncbi:MAG: RsmE family RNA methyltransferase [Niabella sp.]